jgi:hypothetical protein
MHASESIFAAVCGSHFQNGWCYRASQFGSLLERSLDWLRYYVVLLSVDLARVFVGGKPVSGFMLD